MQITVDTLRPEYWDRVLEIYLEGMSTRNATFETIPPSWDIWNQRHHSCGRLVASMDGVILGWTALTPISHREVYSGVQEVSIYVAEASRGIGIGRMLLGALIEESERNGIWTLQAGVFPENIASVRLHLSHGFREVGHRERIARLDGVWRDMLLLERRSALVGNE